MKYIGVSTPAWTFGCSASPNISKSALNRNRKQNLFASNNKANSERRDNVQGNQNSRAATSCADKQPAKASGAQKRRKSLQPPNLDILKAKEKILPNAPACTIGNAQRKVWKL